MNGYRIELQDALPAGDRVLASEQLELDPLPRVVPLARRFVAEQAPALPEDLRDTLLLLTSELVTNAVIHARTRMQVGITVTDRSVLVTVHDQDLGNTELPGPAREGGRGLVLVRALADASATERHPGEGKTTWFRLALPVRDKR